MKLLSARIQNFRVHAGDEPVEIEFDEQLHVIHGSNESGKSTLMDAVHACLFQKYNLTGKVLDAMQPDDGSKPDIEVVFEHDGFEYAARKHFKGQSGTCELKVSRDGRVESTLNGPDAESRLNEVLQVPAAGRGDRKEDQLAHWRLLWISQGHSTDEPTAQINPETGQDLQSVLNAETGGAVVSPGEARWIADLETEVNDRFTSTGKTKSGSRVAILTEEVVECEAELTVVESQASAVEKDSDRYLANGHKLDEIQKQIPTLRTQLGERLAQQASSASLQQKLKNTKSDVELKRRDITSAENCATELAKLKQTIECRNKQIISADEEIAGIDEELQDEQEIRASRVKERDHTDASFTRSRRTTLRVQAQLGVIRARVDLERYNESLRKAQEQANELKEVGKKLAVIPVDDTDVDMLQDLEASLARERAALEAASAKLTMVAKNEIRFVHSGGEEQLAADESHERQIDQEAEIVIGDDEARIRITPGGEDLDQRRERVASANSALRDRLVELGVESVSVAREKLRERQKFESKLQLAQSRLEDVAPDGVDELTRQRDSSSEELNAAQAELERHTAEGDPELPSTVEDTQSELRVKQQRQDEAEAARDSARQRVQSLDEMIAKLKADRQLKVQERDGLHSQNTDSQRQIGDIVESNGDEKELAEKVGSLAEELKALEATSREIAANLEKLQPDLIEAEIERLERAVKSADKESRNIENEQNQLIGRLTANDAVGLNERIGDLKARLQSKGDELEREGRKANAMKLLLETVTSCREEMTRQIMEPLRKKVEPLLRVIFGGVQLDFMVDEKTKLLSLRPLVRNRVQDSFDRLSVGTREQVGVAVRLALAQVLAEEHGGRLPVVLDEPFVNTDPGRLPRALAMLNLAKKDLQVIVLTCDFGDYRELGLDTTQVTEMPPK
ncbi:MAG: hypothetical protein CL946_03195 [Ectothiorhodospiraceae bacterium]|nr:hypothetical protein [Ectothiorhodospiraceae bacterium]